MVIVEGASYAERQRATSPASGAPAQGLAACLAQLMLGPMTQCLLYVHGTVVYCGVFQQHSGSSPWCLAAAPSGVCGNQGVSLRVIPVRPNAAWIQHHQTVCMCATQHSASEHLHRVISSLTHGILCATDNPRNGIAVPCSAMTQERQPPRNLPC